PDAGKRDRIDAKRTARGRNIEGKRIQTERRSADQTSDEPSSRFVVAAQQQKDREEQQQRHHEPRRRLKNRVAHDFFSAGRIFSNENTPTAASVNTVISPSVSKARKSTRITLTMFRPCPSAKL